MSGFQEQPEEAVMVQVPSEEEEEENRSSPAGVPGDQEAVSRVGGGDAEVVGVMTAAPGGRKGLTNILCCLCGRSIQPNGANMCGTCLKDQVDVMEDIPKKGLVIIQCRRCLKWLTKNEHWSVFELESAPFLALVLKKIPGLAKKDLVDAKWIWTEPHSKRLKVNITVRKEVLNKVMLQQDATLEFVVHNKQCNICNKEFTNQTWKAVVQIRQRTGHKRTMLLLEQRILQADAHRKCISVDTVRGGMDIYFGAKHDAAEFVGFISSISPLRSRESTKLVSTDNHSNVRNSQHTVAVDLPALCRDDLVALRKGVGNRLQGSVCVVHRITSVVQFIGPSSGETAEMTAERYWRAPPDALLSAASLVEFVVLDCEPIGDASTRRGAGGASGGGAGKAIALWEVVVVLASEVGSEDNTFTVSTHLGVSTGGRSLEAGDSLLGYDLRDKVFNEALLKGISGDLPDVVLVKRAPPPRNAGSKSKRYKLRSLDGAGGGGSVDSKEPGSGAGKKGGGKALHGGGGDEREIAALLEELSVDEELRAELGLVAEAEEQGDTSTPAKEEEA